MINFNCVVICAIVLISARSTSAITDDEMRNIQADFDRILSSCGDEFGISQKEFMASKKENNAYLNACFYACTLKKMNTINDQGLFVPAVAKALHKKYIHGNDDLDKLDAITDTCSSVNSQAVSDGVQGCERAKLFIQCLIDNKNNLPLMP